MSTLHPSASPVVARFGRSDQSAPARGDQAARLRELVADQTAASSAACPIVAVTSGKGGVGKTTLCVNLAIGLAQAGHRVTLLDADLGLANADVLCGLNPTTRLDAAFEDDADVDTVLARITVEAPGGFRLVPGSVGLPRPGRGGDLSRGRRDRIVEALGRIEDTSDIILIDTGAGIGDHVTSFVEAADAVVVVATPEPTSIADAYALMKCVHARVARDAATDAPALSLLVNQALSRAEGEEVHRRIGTVCARFLRFEPGLVGVIEEDAAAGLAIRERSPVLVSHPRSRMSRDVRNAAAALAKLLELHRSGGVGERRGLLARLLGR